MSQEARKKSFSKKVQIDRLVTLMERNPSVAKGICAKNDADGYWEKVTTELNSLGPPIKNATKWAKVWIDLKAKLKKKLIENKKEINSTGGGPNVLHVLNPLEERICEFLNLRLAVNPSGREFGLSDVADDRVQNTALSQNNTLPISSNAEEGNFPRNSENQENEVPAVQENAVPTARENTIPATPSRRGSSLNIAGQRLKLLQEHGNDFKNLAGEVSNLKKLFKDTYEYTRKMYYLKKDTDRELIKLKKEKLRIYKEEIEKKQKDRSLKLKLKIELLNLQRSANIENQSG